mgnify:CR=1 FL=1
MARANTFGKLFGQSPIRPIQEHMQKVHNCASAIIPFLEATIKDDWKLAQECQKTISTLESEADKLKKSVRLQLPKSLFLPVPRSDLLELVGTQDNIANCSKDIAGLMLGRKIRFPDKISDPILEFAKESIATSAQALSAIHELDELVEVGFSGREVEIVESMIKELDKRENSTDKMQVKIRATLFKIEKDLPPVDVMFLYRIIDCIGDLADQAQKVGNRLQVLMAR